MYKCETKKPAFICLKKELNLLFVVYSIGVMTPKPLDPPTDFPTSPSNNGSNEVDQVYDTSKWYLLIVSGTY